MQSSAKLTLSLDKDIIARAKKYADKRGKSVSKIVRTISRSRSPRSTPRLAKQRPAPSRANFMVC